jgi:hypothetical protein
METWPDYVQVQNLQGHVTGADFIGWKMGDVNVSNNPLSGLDEDPVVESRSMTDIYLMASSADVLGQDTFTIDISTKFFDRIRAGQFSIRVDAGKFSLLGTTEYHPALELSDDNFYIDSVTGVLGFLWDAAAGVTLPDEAILFSMVLTPKVDHVSFSGIQFSPDPVSYYFENEDGEELNVVTLDGELSVPVDEIQTGEIWIGPNPVRDRLHIQIVFEKPAQVELQLINEMAVVVRSIPLSDHLSAEFTHELDLADLPGGLYTVRVITDTGEMTRRIIHL